MLLYQPPEDVDFGFDGTPRGNDHLEIRAFQRILDTGQHVQKERMGELRLRRGNYKADRVRGLPPQAPARRIRAEPEFGRSLQDSLPSGGAYV
ncbi:hypothetical protein D9M68_414310 [compost metagenome]